MSYTCTFDPADWHWGTVNTSTELFIPSNFRDWMTFFHRLCPWSRFQWGKWDVLQGRGPWKFKIIWGSSTTWGGFHLHLATQMVSTPATLLSHLAAGEFGVMLPWIVFLLQHVLIAHSANSGTIPALVRTSWQGPDLLWWMQLWQYLRHYKTKTMPNFSLWRTRR